jgi:hypothetical protein
MPRLCAQGRSPSATFGSFEREPQAQHVEERYLDPQQFLSRQKPPARMVNRKLAYSGTHCKAYDPDHACSRCFDETGVLLR